MASLKRTFNRNVLTLMKGTTLAQIIPIAVSPILTRVYSPEDFGLFSIYFSTVSLFSVLSTGRYELAIMLPDRDEDARAVLKLSILISLLVAFCVLLLVTFFNSFVSNLLGSSDIANWLYLIPFTVFMTGACQSLSYWLNRHKNYSSISNSRIVQSGVTATSNISSVFLLPMANGLIIGQFLGQLASVAYVSKKVISGTDVFKMGIKDCFPLAKRYINFPLFNMPSALVDALRAVGINFFIAKLYSAFILGQFSLAWRITQVPTSILSGALYQVFFQELSVTKKSELYLITRSFTLKLALISCPIYLILFCFSESALMFVFGSNWQLAGQAVSVMSPWLYLNFVSSPLSCILIVLEKQKHALMASVLYMLLPLLIFFFLRDVDFINVLEVISWSMTLFLFVFILFLLSLVRREEGCV